MESYEVSGDNPVLGLEAEDTNNIIAEQSNEGEDSVINETIDCQLQNLEDENEHDLSQLQSSFLAETTTDDLKILGFKSLQHCIICDKIFDMPYKLKRHMMRHMGIKPFKCETCSSRFHCRSHLVDHEKTHSAEYQFHCEMCDKKFHKRSNFRDHMNRHLDKRPFECTMCEKAYYYKKDLVQHLKKCGALRQDERLCGGGQGERKEADETKGNEDGMQVLPVMLTKKVNSVEKRFACEVCGKTFPRRFNLKVHKNTHLDRKPFNCATCSRGYCYRKDLINHLKKYDDHEEEARLFECDVCKATFPSEEDFQLHKTTHEGREADGLKGDEDEMKVVPAKIFVKTKASNNVRIEVKEVILEPEDDVEMKEIQPSYISIVEVQTEDSGGSNEVGCNCVIEDLLSKPFDARSFTDKSKIVSKGRPTPLLPMNCTGCLEKQHYERTTWMCGCKQTSKLYCWPCLLFSDRTSIWARGFAGFGKLQKEQRRHESSQKHIAAQLAQKQFWKSRVKGSLDLAKHNEVVKNNRHVVTCLIDIVCLIAEHGMPFSNFESLVELLRKHDDKLNVHLERSTFSIQHQVAECLADIIVSEVREDVKKAPFVALIIDEGPDAVNKYSTVLRYPNETGDVQERFIGFADVGDCSLAEHIFKTLKEYQCEEKLIAAIIPEDCVLVKARYDKVLFLPTSKTELFLRHSLEHIKECKNFFVTLLSLASFLFKGAFLPDLKNLDDSPLITVYEHKNDILHLLNSIHNVKANDFHATLQDSTFNFLLHLLAPITTYLKDLQKNLIDSEHARQVSIHKHLDSLKTDFDVFSIGPGDTDTQFYRNLYETIINSLKTKITKTYWDLDGLDFINLLDSAKFQAFLAKFPDQHFASLRKSYGEFFELPRLRSELSVMYSDADLGKSSDILRDLVSEDLTDTLPELTRLASLAKTIPTGSEAWRRIDEYVRQSQSEDKFTVLSLLSIEKVALSVLRKRPDFHEKVIDVLVAKLPEIELSYKR